MKSFAILFTCTYKYNSANNFHHFFRILNTSSKKTFFIKVEK
ncbi:MULTISPECIES: hypothetical protein [unclassified Spiroplasma]